MEMGKQERKKKFRVGLWGTYSVLRPRFWLRIPECHGPSDQIRCRAVVGGSLDHEKKTKSPRHQARTGLVGKMLCRRPGAHPGHAWYVAPRLPCCHATHHPPTGMPWARGPVSTPGTAMAASASRRPYFFGCGCAFVHVFVLVRACAFVRRVMRRWTVCGSLDILRQFRTTGGSARDDGWVDLCDRRARPGETAQRARRVS